MSLQSVTNELDFAQKIIEKNDYLGEKEYQSLIILAKYYLTFEKKSKNETINSIHSFLKLKDSKYIRDYKHKYIKTIVNRAFEKQLILYKPIEIYLEEIETIRNIRNLNKEKVLFSYLICAKTNKFHGNNSYWVSDDSKDIFKRAELNHTKQKREFLIGDLVELNYLTSTNQSVKNVDNNSMHVNYAKNDGELFCIIDNFNQFGLQYEKLLGINDIIECEKCGILIRKKSNKVRYCASCAREILQEQKNKWKRDNWNKKEEK